MKSHGVKPIKVVQPVQPTRGRAAGEDSQDQDFEAEESQEASGGGLGGLDDSGPVLFDDDEDELALTPSLPKTSPGQHLRASSQQSTAGQTDATSFSDEDLPPLERFLLISAKKRQALKRQPSHNLSSTTRKRTSASSESDEDVVREASRRIRGVLPASWLRLDQRPNKPAAQNAWRRSPEPSPERVVRRGVALPRQASPRPFSTAPLLLFDESEESDSGPPRRNVEVNGLAPTVPETIVIEDNDEASDMEEDTIDWMLPGRKRSRTDNTPIKAKKQKGSGTQSVFKGRPNQASRQPRIDQVLGRTKHRATGSTSSKRQSGDQLHRRREGSPAPRRPRKRAATPPLLSILDVVEPDAPKFVKIAARAVKRRTNLGKTSPTRKLISLATRSDNFDALSVLRDWKSGRTKPRIPTPSVKKSERPRNRPVLEERHANTTLRRSSVSQNLVRQSGLDGILAMENENNIQPPQSPTQPLPASRPSKTVRDRGPNLHPAQLEAEEGEDRRQQLNSRKRTLDAFYRRTLRTLDALTDDGLSEVLDVNFTLQNPVNLPLVGNLGVDIPQTSPKATAKPRAARPRSRKIRRPQYIDLEAPQYTRANDPLPADFSVIESQEQQQQQQQQQPQSRDKLQGLGPYGTHYTHDFAVFPLDTGVFFHESTIIGRGFVREAVDIGLSDRIRHQRLTVSFTLDGQTLRWGHWDDKTSSEFGILVDWVADQLCLDGLVDVAAGRKAVEAAEFVLGYILRSSSVRSDVEEKAFVSRCLEVFSSFVGRFESVDWGTVTETTKRTQLEIVTRLITAILASHSLAHASGGDPMQTMSLDDLLKKSAIVTIRRLFDCGTEELRTLYGDLQRSAARERGIRSDCVLANCWVLMIRVLESAGIPRSFFWDVAHSVMLSQGVTSGSNVPTFERLWQDMFMLLPLCEIDNSGVLVSGMRHTAPVEGWTLPQQLLKRVFQLYQANPRQPTGFNDYCRALVARCHFLVQHWGWRKCTGIIGAIFDFFGSQNLAHLRNEEVYKSPRFLEELDRKPSLSIEPEDRCFHIFIKLLALTIQRLKDLNRDKDIKNLIARTLPNHNRQYLKEATIHQHDLAALRNHHDLLCTLFWASPPALRPPVRLIEKLILPSSAHKEACLINVRAWAQLARFVVARKEGREVFQPLAAWRNNVFNQVLDQYRSAAEDIEQQFRALGSGGGEEEMVARNKASALDVLQFAVRVGLEVVRRAEGLGEMLYALNKGQLQKVFTSLDYQSPGFDWGILRVAIETLEHFVDRIDKASEEQFSSEVSENDDAQHVEEAVMLMHEHLTKDFFWMSRTVLALSPEVAPGRHSLQAAFAENIVALGAKMAARLINNRVTQLSPYFSTGGKYGLFTDLPERLSTPDQKYLSLFLAVLVKNHIFDFKDLGTNIFGLWMLSIVKPLRFLGYENYLAETLKCHGLPFLKGATVAVGTPPDYNTNVDFFSCAMHHMRKTRQEAGSVQAKQQYRDEFFRILQLVMKKMKHDLALLRTDAAEHGQYIDFVRQVISLIKSHGVNICVIDEFFTKPSVDYSPPTQDPKLHTAGIIAYGIRLSEKDATADRQLFHYLHSNLKIALGNDELEQECRILGKAMRNAHVMSFMLGYMFPAIIQASAQVSECWPLLEVYTVAFGNVVDGGCVPKELPDEDMEHALGLLNCILAWFESLRNSQIISFQQLHIATLLTSFATALQPSVTAYLFNNPSSSHPTLENTLNALSEFFISARTYLKNFLANASNINTINLPTSGDNGAAGSAGQPASATADAESKREKLKSAGYGSARARANRNNRVEEAPALELPDWFGDQRVSLYEQRPIEQSGRLLPRISDEERERLLESVEEKFDKLCLKEADLEALKDGNLGVDVYLGLAPYLGTGDFPTSDGIVELSERLRQVHASAFWQTVLLAYHPAADPQHIERLRQLHKDAGLQKNDWWPWMTAQLTGDQARWFSHVRFDAPPGSGALHKSPLADRPDPEYPACMELLAAVQSQLTAPLPSENRLDSRPPTVVMSVLNRKGRTLADSVIDDVATDLKADVVHLDAQDIARLVGKYLGQNPYSARGTISMLGYAAAEMNGRLAPRVKADENEIGMVAIALPSRLRSFLSNKDNNLSNVVDARWEDLKLGAALEALVGAVEQKRRLAAKAPSKQGVKAALHDEPRDLIIHLHDYVEINSLHAAVIRKLQAIADRMTTASRKVLLVGSSASNMDKSSQWREQLVELGRDSAHVIPFHATKVDGVEEVLDNFYQNIANVEGMLQSMVGENVPVNLFEPFFANDFHPTSHGMLSGHLYDVQWVHRVASVMVGRKNEPAHEKYTSQSLDYALRFIAERDSHWAGAVPGIRAPNAPPNKEYDNHERQLLSGLINAKDIHTTFNDIIVPSETKDSLVGLTSLSLIRPEAFSYGVLKTERIPGCLLYGPPGTGKTLLAKAVAKESGANMLEVSAASINDKWVGQSEKNVRALFSLARKLAPCVIFLDEADALLAARRNGPGRAAHRETITQFLREWDGLTTDMRAFIMVATNRPFDLDEAVLRRLPRKILVDLPLAREREAILKVMLKDETLAGDVDLAKLAAAETELYSGSDLKNLCVSAAMEAVREEVRAKEKWEGEGEYVFPERRVLNRGHFEKGLREISASISEDMESLKAIRKFDERYGDAGRKRKVRRSMGFEVVEGKMGSEEARVRQVAGVEN
ncbi:hypothetical protein N0V88_000435 [Collariella sp. IMI 366227]|nr:hypothetical protein N0V88_000435 [Collariella sp. IMI 366227]